MRQGFQGIPPEALEAIWSAIPKDQMNFPSRDGACRLYHWVVHRIRMIVSFRDDWLRAFFVDDARSRNIPADLESRLFRRLQMIDDATTDQDLRVPPSNHFEKLRGALADFHSVRVNRQWRLIFRWNGGRGEASGLYLDDHSYR